MEPTEISEFSEHMEHEGGQRNPAIISLSISILAVLVAVVTVLGHRSHTQAVLAQAKASDEWNLYQAKKIRQSSIQNTTDLLAVLAPGNALASKKTEDYKTHTAKWDDDLKEESETAKKYEEEVEHQELMANRFDFGEAFLQIAVVLSSITLLTHRRAFWYFGLLVGLAGILCAASALLIH